MTMDELDARLLEAWGGCRGSRCVGRSIMTKVNATLDQHAMHGIMHAQTYLDAWYTGHGGVREGAVFVEAGIEHVKMRFTPSNAA